MHEDLSLEVLSSGSVFDVVISLLVIILESNFADFFFFKVKLHGPLLPHDPIFFYDEMTWRFRSFV